MKVANLGYSIQAWRFSRPEEFLVIARWLYTAVFLWLQVLVWTTLRKKAGQKWVIGLHQNRSAHASKLTRFRLSYQHLLVSLPAWAGKPFRNLVNLLAYAGWLRICKLTCLRGSVWCNFFLSGSTVFGFQIFNRNEPNKRGLSYEMLDELHLLSSFLTHTYFSLRTVEATCGITLVCNTWQAMLKKVASMSIT